MSEFIWQRALQNFQAQRFSEAIADCEQLIHGEPVWSMAFPLLSSIYLHRGQVKLATYYAVAATQHLDQLDWEGVLSVSTALMLVGENQLAHSVLSDIEKRNFFPEKAAVHLGRQLSSLEDIPAALSCFQKAVAAGDNSGLAYLSLGLTLAHIGNFEQAAAAYEKASTDPQLFAHSQWARSQLSVNNGMDDRIEQMQAILAQVGVTAVDRAYLGYALFKEYERRGDFDQSWSFLELGAQARRTMQAYDAQAESRIFDQLLNRFEHPASRDINTLPQQDKVPIFIVGMPRTGTTLLERILGNHSGIKPCGELPVFHQQLQWVADTVIPINLDQRIGDILDNIDLRVLGQRYLQKTHMLTGGFQYFSDKNPMNFMLCGAILEAIPDARIIHMQRNPVDACFSNLKELFAPGYYTYSYQLDECAAHYKNHARLMKGWQRLYPGKILGVKYEDLVARPEAEAQRIFQYLGLPYSSDLVDIGKNQSITTTASSMQVRDPIHVKNVDGWKRYSRYLSALEINLADEIAGY